MDSQAVLRWGLGISVFLVKSYEKLLIREKDVFPYNSIYISEVLRKVCFFTWLATRGVIHSISWCFMCNEVGEDVDHLLLHCSLAMRLGGHM